MTDRPASWGRYPRAEPGKIIPWPNRDAPLPSGQPSLLAWGNGRSYGDVCLNNGGTQLVTRHLDRFIAFNREHGILRCEAGVLFDEILALIVPAGWFLPVTPGTRFVTVGGAIANDVHGKNHHRAGSFGCHVNQFELLRSNGERLTCSPSSNPELYAASIGGLGLTGLITWAEIRLTRIPGPWLGVETSRFGNLDEFFAQIADANSRHEHTVAWIDCMAPAGQRGRGLLSSGNFVGAAPGKVEPRNGRLRVPIDSPIPLLGGPGLRLLNRLYYHRRIRQHTVSHYRPFFYPLDGIRDWNRLYGRRGFLQHQSVVPESANEAVSEMLEAISASGTGSFLAVLKTFGAARSPGLLSFPRQGTTLALDFPFRGHSTLALLDRLDEIVRAADGAVYPAKDARMSGASFRQFFPDWKRFSLSIDPGFESSFWRRVMMDPVDTR